MTDHHHVNALGGGVANYDDPRLNAIFMAAVEHLQEHPELCGLAGDPTGDQPAGFMLIPIFVRQTPEGRLSHSGLMHFVADGHELTIPSMANALHEAGLQWYQFVNGKRMTILEAYVAGDVQMDELEGLLEEALVDTCKALGLAFLPLDRGHLGRVLAALRAKLAE